MRPDTNLGHGRADGILAWSLPTNEVRVAVVEAKSSRTFDSLVLYFLETKLALHITLVCLVSFTVAGAIGWGTGHWVAKWIVPPVVSLASVILFFWVSARGRRYARINVVEQVKRYPANEGWVALSTDSLNSLGDDLQLDLIEACRADGIGLVRVTSATRIEVILTPLTKAPPAGLKDFLECYSRGRALRQQVLLRPNGQNPNPAEPVGETTA